MAEFTISSESTLSRTAVKFEFDLPDWHFLIELAERNGWRPAGTVFQGIAPELVILEFGGRDAEGAEEDWDRALREECFLRDYFSNSGQMVLPDDANNLGKALQRALPDLPVHDALGSKRREDALPLRVAQWLEMLPDQKLTPDNRVLVTAFEWFSGQSKQGVSAFGQFCRRGTGFYIS